jgi:acetyl-CoA C-acetyltransferase
MDPRTPVVVGGGQLNQRDNPVEPVNMIVEAARRASADAGAPGLAEAVESVRIVGILSWRYRDPGRLVGERLGAPVRHTVYTGNGGSHAQSLVSDAAEDIAAGRCDIVLVGGAEAWRTRMALKAEGRRPGWTVQHIGATEPERRPDVPMRDPAELRAGLDRPAFVYPLFEQALRLRDGRSVTDHRARVAELWSRFSEVAAANPAAWTRRLHTPEKIMTPARTNRVVAWPYTKLMNANNHVDQAAAVLVCSVGAARRLGVPEDRWVFPRAGTEASDTPAVAARPSLDGSVAIRAAGRAALELAGLGLDDLGPIDLYSCFPSAVRIAADALGLPTDDPTRPLTVTGGLTFAGGPWNNYSTHAIATMAGEVRRTRRPGLVTANSGYLTKHAIGVYAPTPGGGFQRRSAQAEADAVPPTAVADEYAGPAELEAWTVVFDRDGAPRTAMAALRTPSGSRTLAGCAETQVVERLVDEETAGAKADVRPEGTFMLR